ncbi:hypothetical protein KQH29_00280 [bacterium]|nr:hypothetical protein [bacterium]
MKIQRRITIMALAIVFAGTSYLAWAQHQHQGQGHDDAEQPAATESTSQPAHQEGMMHEGMMKDEMMEHGMMGQDKQAMQSMMEKMGMSPEMIRRHQILMKSEIAKTDPQALLSMSEDLKLTESQIDQLETIVQDARERSESVLNSEQQSELNRIPESPENMQRMMMQMHEKMQRMHGDQGEGMSMMMCPMMQSMSGEKSDDGTNGHEAHH